MLFLGFLNNLTELILVLSSLAFLGFATWLCAPLKCYQGLKTLWFGLFVLFLGAVFYVKYDFLTYYGVSIRVVAFLRLFLCVCATVLFMIASSEILLSKPLSVQTLMLFISFGLVLSFYGVYISNSAEFQNNIETGLPMIGLMYLFLAFISRPNLKNHIGEIFAAMSVLGLIEQTAVHLFLSFDVSFIFSLVLLFMLAGSYFLMLAEFYLKQKTQMEENLKTMSENMLGIIKSSPFPIIISTLTDDAVVFANQNALKLFELNALELARYHFGDFFVDSNNRKLLLEKLEHAKEVKDFEVLVKSALGQTPFWLTVSANVIEYDGELSLYAAFQDITERKQREKLLQNQANRDPLTAIYNRRYFETIAEQKIKESLIKKQGFAVLMIDADHFKNINDQYGHKIGDKVLIELAHTIERSLRPDDIVARYGGEEFVVFLNGVDSNSSLVVAERLRKTVEQSVVYSDLGEPVSWTVSIGVAPSGISDSVSLMIKMADDAMYVAKQKGRNLVCLYNVDDLSRFETTLKPKEQLHPVLKDQEVEISLLDGMQTNLNLKG
ncbi:MAG: sensor domain-containing diguanylate cyclase [Alphaproteobacteria bacterium]|nr:sensor domain-containing diguanylate cyclase [Alphaproteobacteria bacterium]